MSDGGVGLLFSSRLEKNIDETKRQEIETVTEQMLEEYGRYHSINEVNVQEGDATLEEVDDGRVTISIRDGTSPYHNDPLIYHSHELAHGIEKPLWGDVLSFPDEGLKSIFSEVFAEFNVYQFTAVGEVRPKASQELTTAIETIWPAVVQGYNELIDTNKRERELALVQEARNSVEVGDRKEALNKMKQVGEIPPYSGPPVTRRPTIPRGSGEFIEAFDLRDNLYLHAKTEIDTERSGSYEFTQDRLQELETRLRSVRRRVEDYESGNELAWDVFCNEPVHATVRPQYSMGHYLAGRLYEEGNEPLEMLHEFPRYRRFLEDVAHGTIEYFIVDPDASKEEYDSFLDGYFGKYNLQNKPS